MSARIPTYRSARRLTSTQLPPARLPVFRSVVAHPPAPFLVEQAGSAAAASQGDKGKSAAKPSTDVKGKGKEKDKSDKSGTGVAGTTQPPIGPHHLLYTTSPRPLIPLTNSPYNHKLWNPPPADSVASRAVEKDESGRLARFASRFAGAGDSSSAGQGQEGQYGVESDLSFLEGASLQSPGTALGKRDIVGPQKSAKKGKK